MPLLPPGHAAPMPPSQDVPDIGAPAAPEPPPIPPRQTTSAPPPPINPGIHQPEEEEAEIHVMEAAPEEMVPPPAPVVDISPPPPAAESYLTGAPGTSVNNMEEAQRVSEMVAPPPPAAPPAPTRSAQHNMAPAGTSGSTMKALEELAEDGFEGLDIGFGSFPMVRLQGQEFSTNEDEVLGNTFLCVIHASKVKWLYKAEDNNTTDEFVYSFDKEFTTNGKPIEEVTAEWAAQGKTAPVWKKYLDVTAQLVDPNTKELGRLVILSVPNNSVPRLTGYITTLKLGSGCAPNQMITQVYPGQKVTNAVKPFHPWAFKAYMRLDRFTQ